MSTHPVSVTLTFLFTDLVGSTALLQRLGEDRAGVVFERHHQQVAAAVAVHGGDELEWLGDGMLAAFASSVEALRCAIAIQKATRKPISGERLAVRIGVHTGEAMRREGGYFGNTLVIARRLCDAAHAGQILSTSFMAAMLAGRQFSFRDVGELTLKGIDEPVRVVEVSTGRARPAPIPAPIPAAISSPEPTELATTAAAPSRRPWALSLVAAAAVVAIGLVGVAAAFLGGAPGGAPGVASSHQDAVVQLQPLLLWRDPTSGATRYEPLGWASGTLVDERGVIVTSQTAIDPGGFRQPYDALGVAFADASGLASRPEYLAQVMGVGEGGSELAVLLITSTLDGALPGAALGAARSGDAAGLGRGDGLELVGFPTGPETALRVPQTTRTSDARDFALVAGRPALIETGAQLTAGEHGGGAFADGRLVGVLVPSPSSPGTAAVRPLGLADAMLGRVRALLDGRPVGGDPTVSLDAPPVIAARSIEWVATATIDAMPDGAAWSWECVGPDGRIVSGSWPPVLAWNAGSTAVGLELRCRRDDGFELAAGTHRLRVLQVLADGTERVLAEASGEARGAGAESRLWRAVGGRPGYEVDVPSEFRCLSCDTPHRVEGLLVLETTDAQLAFRTYAGTAFETLAPGDLATMLVDAGVDVIAEPLAVELDGHSGVVMEATVDRDFDGTGPFEGARFLAGTRGTWTFLSVDGVAISISAETVGSAGWEERVASMDAIVTSLRFR